jgi:ABC-type multidrug transport system fused ATPase/permease subunit
MFLNTIADKFFADFLRVYRILPRHLQRAALRVFACVVLQAMLEVCGILAISFLAISIAAPERLFALKPVESAFRMFPQLTVLQEDPRLFSLLAAVGTTCATAAKNGVTALVNLMTSRLGERIALFAGETLFRRFLYSPFVQHLAGDSGIMFQGLSRRTQLAKMVTQLMAVYTYAAVTLALTVTLVCFTPGIILLVMLIMGGIAACVYRTLRSSIDQAGKDVAEWSKAETKVTLNAMRGIRETLIYRQQEVFFERFGQACKAGVPDRAFLTLAPPVPTWILETSGFVVILAVLWIMLAVQDASAARITAVLTMIMLIAWRILPLLNRSLSALVAVRGSRHQALECLSRVEEALENPVPELPDPDPDFRFRESISFRNMSFAYPKAEEACLRDLTFTLPRGSRVGIIGRSGAGKSTLAAVLSGLTEPTQGEMLVDGRVLNPSELAAYRRQVGYVPQNPYIMGGTIAENVAFSQWGKPWDEEKVLRACRMAAFDVALQRGIEFSLGQDGAGLSGGEAQRLSIARALYADPSVLILDEATSALDSGVETAVMNTIFALPRGITTVTIAHRLSTVERCDSLVWIDAGAIRMTGPPYDVLPKYKEFLEQTNVPDVLSRSAPAT